MLLDNLFAHLGGATTAALLLCIVACVGFPAAASVLCPLGYLQRRRLRGR
jgi:hypothetical protein